MPKQIQFAKYIYIFNDCVPNHMDVYKYVNVPIITKVNFTLREC